MHARCHYVVCSWGFLDRNGQPNAVQVQDRDSLRPSSIRGHVGQIVRVSYIYKRRYLIVQRTWPLANFRSLRPDVCSPPNPAGMSSPTFMYNSFTFYTDASRLWTVGLVAQQRSNLLHLDSLSGSSRGTKREERQNQNIGVVDKYL